MRCPKPSRTRCAPEATAARASTSSRSRSRASPAFASLAIAALLFCPPALAAGGTEKAPARARDAAAAVKKLVLVSRFQGTNALPPALLLLLAQSVQGVLQAGLHEQFSVLSYADHQLVELATINGVDLLECADDSCVAIGRKVSADYVVSGSLTDLGPKLGLVLSIQDVRSAETLLQKSLFFARKLEPEAIVGLVEQAATQMAATLKAPGR
jgi:hypothetical protein